MLRRVKSLMPLVAIVVVVGALVVIADSGGYKATPYLSALSNAFATPAYARGGCEFKACAGGSRHNLACAKVTTNTVCTIFSGTCISGGCP